MYVMERVYIYPSLPGGWSVYSMVWFMDSTPSEVATSTDDGECEFYWCYSILLLYLDHVTIYRFLDLLCMQIRGPVFFVWG